jgi:23S rRNA (cytosine1962-C5)-methyltransferase
MDIKVVGWRGALRTIFKNRPQGRFLIFWYNLLMKQIDLATGGWHDYELLDSGENKKLERYGKFVIIRPETQAIWKPLRPELWKKADAEFRFEGSKGSWRGKNAPEPWNISWNGSVQFSLRLTSFKHTGVFPEQAPNWGWVEERVKNLKKTALASTVPAAQPPKVLNLFGYTGIASIAAALSGAQVTHCDASKQSNTWARDNATLSNVPENGIRYITDDALKFVEREVRRGAAYDGIILDPPAFGRGANGEVWHIEDDITILLNALRKLLARKPGAFLLLNGYAAGYAPQSFLQSAESSFPEAKTGANGEFGELRIEERDSGRCVPAGIYVRFIL